MKMLRFRGYSGKKKGGGGNKNDIVLLIIVFPDEHDTFRSNINRKSFIQKYACIF